MKTWPPWTKGSGRVSCFSTLPRQGVVSFSWVARQSIPLKKWELRRAPASEALVLQNCRLRVLTLNVNGIREEGKHLALKSFLDQTAPDIIILTETHSARAELRNPELLSYVSVSPRVAVSRTTLGCGDNSPDTDFCSL